MRRDRSWPSRCCPTNSGRSSGRSCPSISPDPRGGRPRLDDRKALTGILFVLKTGIPWEDLPCEMGCGSGMTCWRRLRDWQADGTWVKIHGALLGRPPRCRQDRLVAGADRQQHGAGRLRRRGHRPQPGGPRQAGEQAPRDHRRRRHPAGVLGDGGQPQRHQRDGPAGQRAARGRRQAGASAAQARRLAGRPGLRLGAASPGAALPIGTRKTSVVLPIPRVECRACGRGAPGRGPLRRPPTELHQVLRALRPGAVAAHDHQGRRPSPRRRLGHGQGHPEARPVAPLRQAQAQAPARTSPSTRSPSPRGTAT